MAEISRRIGPFDGPEEAGGYEGGSENARVSYAADSVSTLTPGQGVERIRSTILDSAIPRRTTVMCALRALGHVIHEYQSDSLSIMPSSPASLVPSRGRPPPRTNKSAS